MSQSLEPDDAHPELVRGLRDAVPERRVAVDEGADRAPDRGREDPEPARRAPRLARPGRKAATDARPGPRDPVKPGAALELLEPARDPAQGALTRSTADRMTLRSISRATAQPRPLSLWIRTRPRCQRASSRQRIG